MKNSLLIKFAFIACFFSTLLISCTKEQNKIKPATQLKAYTGTLRCTFLPGSIEKIFTSQMPWEYKAINHYNVIKTDTSYYMWYDAFAEGQLDFDGSYCIAQSVDGKNWVREDLVNNENIVVKGDNFTGIAGACVFKDNNDKTSPYKMICIKLVDGKQNTFLYSSTDGRVWKMDKKLYDMMQDTQFGVIDFNGLYYIFSRYNDYSNGYQRAIGLSTLDHNFNIVQQPYLLLEADINSTFEHIYNNAASKIDDSTIILLPTYFDEATSAIRIKVIYSNNLKDYYVIDDNINNKLFPDNNVNWAIVSPGVIPTGEKNTYWVYYFGTAYKHGAFNYVAKLNITYYRIKMVIEQ